MKPGFHDFIVIGCDGIFDRLNNQHVLDVLWDTINVNKSREMINHLPTGSIHELTGSMADSVIKEAALE